MPRLNSSMLAAIQSLIEGNVARIGCLIIDENPSAVGGGEETGGKLPVHNVLPGTVTARQQQVIAYLLRFGCPLWNITYGSPITRTQLKALFNGNQIEIPKQHPNAFKEPELERTLVLNNITHLVVMGWHIDACVRATIGSFMLPPQQDNWGAVQLGFVVHTCTQILHGGEPTFWSFDPVDPHSRGSLNYYEFL